MDHYNPSGINPTLLKLLYDTTPEELIAINSLIKDLKDDQIHQFVMIYRTKRKDPQTILLCCLLGFVCVAGVHRFLVGEIGMGILYVFTGGLCLVGTIVDAINHKTIALDYNQKMVAETMMMMNLGRSY
ncbi:MAG: TM2 domain-containing protein [Chitinophagaceae bacterium]|nr:MAG: TM2 domain-containing protein [Chitinophagaceae bacterium]